MIISFLPLEVGLSYFTGAFLVTKHLCKVQNFDLAKSTMTFDLCDLTVGDRALVFRKKNCLSILC